MWALFEGDGADGNAPGPVGSVMENGVLHAWIGDLRPSSLSVDGVVPVPGYDPSTDGYARYWVTGLVGDQVERFRVGHRFWEAHYRFDLRVGDLRFVAHLVASRRRVKIRPGSPISVECVFKVSTEPDTDGIKWPQEWYRGWQVLRSQPQGERGRMLDLEPPLADGATAEPADRRRRTPLLLDTDYGGGPLWYRSADNKGPWGMDLGYFPVSATLQARLLRWTAGDHHLHDDYEDDDPEHEVAWHEEGLALLGELRRELGPAYDIKYSHDLEA